MNPEIAKPGKQEIVATVIELAASQVDVDPAAVTLESHFYNDLNYDSLDAVDFTMKIEETFKLSLPDPDADKFKTVGDVVTYVCDHNDPATL